MWIFGSQMGLEFMTALMQVFTDKVQVKFSHYRPCRPFVLIHPYITIGKAYLCLSTVFSPKVMAILRCIELLTKNLIREYTCYDSRAALAALVNTATKSSLVWECMQGKLSELNKVTLVWIPRHQGILSNEEAERLAKEGAIKVAPKQYTTMPFSVGKKLIKKQLELEHQARWAACTGCRQSKMLMRYPA
jgi:hypothetical protein